MAWAAVVTRFRLLSISSSSVSVALYARDCVYLCASLSEAKILSEAQVQSALTVTDDIPLFFHMEMSLHTHAFPRIYTVYTHTPQRDTAWRAKMLRHSMACTRRMVKQSSSGKYKWEKLGAQRQQQRKNNFTCGKANFTLAIMQGATAIFLISILLVTVCALE